jgi:excinuclease ABC subunit B
VVVEQLIRPTGLLDPVIEVRPTENQIDDLMEEVRIRNERNERTLVTTFTKRMAEELTEYLQRHGIMSAYIHSDVDTLERVRIMDELRKGNYDVLVGVNLLREGLDLPEVSLVAILDADKEGFLRNQKSLTQTIGRAARHINGRAIMYADTITGSMQATIDETNRRREKQLKYNEEHNITPRAIHKAYNMQDLIKMRQQTETRAYVEVETPFSVVADPIVERMTQAQLERCIKDTRKRMAEAAKKLDFVEAAHLRDEMLRMEEEYKKRT